MAARTRVTTGFRTALGVIDAETDADRICAWLNDPDINKGLSMTTPLTRDTEREFLGTLGNNHAQQLFLIMARKDDHTDDWTPVGGVGLHNISYLHGTATIGIYLGEKEYHRKGYGAEAAYLTLHYAFSRLGLRKVRWTAYEFNTASIACAKRCSGTIEVRLRENRWRDGAYHDEVLLGIFREKFLPLWDDYQQHKCIPRNINDQNTKSVGAATRW